MAGGRDVELIAGADVFAAPDEAHNVPVGGERPRPRRNRNVRHHLRVEVVDRRKNWPDVGRGGGG